MKTDAPGAMFTTMEKCTAEHRAIIGMGFAEFPRRLPDRPGVSQRRLSPAAIRLVLCQLRNTSGAVINDHMKSIAITIDEPTLKLLDEVAAASARPRNRSALVRIAVREFVEREQRRQTESQESEIIRKHRGRLARQARALVGAQAKP